MLCLNNRTWLFAAVWLFASAPLLVGQLQAAEQGGAPASGEAPQAGLAPPPPESGEKDEIDSMMAKRNARMAETLKLDEKQRKAFDEATKQMREVMRASMDFHRVMRESVQSDSFDEAKLRDMLHKHNEQSEPKIIAAVKAMHEFQQTLNAEQKTKFKALQEERKQERPHGMMRHKSSAQTKKQPQLEKI